MARSKIATVTVPSGGQSSIVFSSIPQNYTDLLLVIKSQSTISGVEPDNIFAQVNSITSGYSAKLLYATSGTINSVNNPNNFTNKGMVGISSSTGSAGNAWGVSTTYIPNYTKSVYKTFSVDAAAEGSSNNAWSSQFAMLAGLLSNNAAITSLTLTHAYGNFGQGSTATLYGVTAASVLPTTITTA